MHLPLNVPENAYGQYNPKIQAFSRTIKPESYSITNAICVYYQNRPAEGLLCYLAIPKMQQERFPQARLGDLNRMSVLEF